MLDIGKKRNDCCFPFSKVSADFTSTDAYMRLLHLDSAVNDMMTKLGTSSIVVIDEAA